MSADISHVHWAWRSATLQTSGVGSASVSSRADHMRLSFPETRKTGILLCWRPRIITRPLWSREPAGSPLAHGMQTSEHMEASHVVPGLAISGTQPSATASYEDDGSMIGLAEVSTLLTSSQPQPQPLVQPQPQTHRTGSEAVPRLEHGRRATGRSTGTAG